VTYTQYECLQGGSSIKKTNQRQIIIGATKRNFQVLQVEELARRHYAFDLLHKDGTGKSIFQGMTNAIFILLVTVIFIIIQ
jgi:hypothetical protein